MASSNVPRREFNLDQPRMPGDFPHTPSAHSSTTIDSPAAHPAMQPAWSAQSGASISTLTPQALQTVRRSEPSVAANQALKVQPVTSSVMAIEPSTSEADEDEATLVEHELLLPSVNPSTKSQQGQSTSGKASTAQQRSRIPKASAIPLVRPLYTSSDTPRSDSAKPKPSVVAKQHQQQRTFQQGWLREAAVIERAQRRSRSRSRGASRA